MEKTAPSQPAIDERLVKAIGHPLRQRILVRLNEGVASPSRIARDLDEPLGTVSYHVKILLEQDAIELVETRPVRGAVEHFYRPTMRVRFDDENWARLPASLRAKLFDQTLQQVWEHLVSASESGGLEDRRTHVSWTPLDLDEQGYADAAKLLEGTLDGLLGIQAEVANRRAEADGSGESTAEHRTEVAIVHFHRA